VLRDLSVNAGGNRLAVASGVVLPEERGCFALIDLKSFQPIDLSFLAPIPYWVAEFSPDDSVLVVGSTVSSIRPTDVRILDGQTGHEAFPPLPHPSGVGSLIFSPDGQRVATGDIEGSVRIWDFRRRELITPPMRHERGISGIDFSPDGQRLATGSSDATAIIWDARTGQPLTPPLRHGGPVHVAEFHRSGSWLLTAAGDGEVRIWKLFTARESIRQLRRFFEVNASVELTADGATRALSAENLIARWREIRAKEPKLDSL
jgi:WD40 repeat protein